MERMIKLLTSTTLSIIFCMSVLPLSAQIETLFEKEEPEFFMTVLPSGEVGVVELEIYFTHSRLSNAEVSFWMIDRGDNRLNDGKKQIIGALRTVANRQKETIRVEGLVEGNFYAFGLDYRRISTLLNTKFSSKMLQEGYAYLSPPKPKAYVEKENIIFPRKDFVAKSTSSDCDKPKLSIRIAPTGYCQDEANPAILISNDKNQNWEFSIETRGMAGDWRPILSGGKRQQAKGAITRTEPLCLLSNGRHFIRVLAWGEGCSEPVSEAIDMPIRIGEYHAFTSKEATTTRDYEPPVATYQPTLPDTCLVKGMAKLIGNKLIGNIELDRYSLCGDFSPYAIVRYVNPANRDIELDPIPLYVGEPVSFEFELMDADLNRTIHPVNVVTYVRSNNEDRVMSAFWIRSEKQRASVIAEEKPTEKTTPTTFYSYEAPLNEPVDLTTRSAEPLQRQPETKRQEPILTQEVNTINVTASDPNCTQIHDLQMVYDLKRSQKPLYISWLSPRCCQEEGCEYTIWSGNRPDQLSLVMKGYKFGATIKELLDPNKATDKYFEVVVKTKNGNRKAAYVIGEGPKYGIEEILAYHDRFNPVQSDSLMFIKEQEPNETLKGEGTFQWDNPVNNPTTVDYVKPELPISRFSPCKYRKPIQLTADNPIHSGDYVSLQYDYDRTGYKYSLYFQPLGSQEWSIAADTKELSDKAKFDFRVGAVHSGNYIMLLYKPEKGWGCLTAPLEEGLEILVIE